MGKQNLTGKQIILLWIRNSLLGCVLLVAAAYLVDYAVLRLRGSPTGTVRVRPVYAVPQKNKSTEFMLGDAEDQTCVNSLFPHLGDQPCWYLKKHTEQQIDM